MRSSEKTEMDHLVVPTNRIEPRGSLPANDLAETVLAGARLVAAAPDLHDACKRAEQFIANGIEFGFIRLPDAGTPDPAHDTLPAIRAALAKAGRQS